MYGFFVGAATILFLSCKTVDFIPDPEFSPHYPGYSKSDWDEVEVYFDRPNKRISIQGEIRIRDFENSGRVNDYIDSIKKDMFKLKMDGVWILGVQVQSVQDSVFQTMDSRGNITHIHESEKNMKVWTGYAFRDR